MRKVIYLLLLGVLSYSNIYAGERNPYPKSYFDFGFGSGVNYGLLGFKGVLGYKGNGLLLGLGSKDGFYTRQVGVQFSYRWVFLNFGSGDIGTYKVGNTSEIKVAEGIFTVVGGKLNLNRAKTIFLDFGLGISSKSSFINAEGEKDTVGGLSGLLGIGFKIG